MAADSQLITIEVVYGTRDEQTLVELEVPEGSTILEAVQRSGLLQRYPAIDPNEMSVGIFGRIASKDQALKSGDRVEIYRPLPIDPIEARRQRAKKGVRK